MAFAFYGSFCKHAKRRKNIIGKKLEETKREVSHLGNA